MSLLLDEHREYLADVPRVTALRRAIHATVRPGDVVVDLGCGTGLLGLMACEAGAARVYAIDGSGMIAIARAIARKSPFADRIEHVAGHSTHITLPERADALVFDQIGRLGFEAGVLEYALDARRRLLKPDARIMPGPVTLHLALAASGEVRSRIDFWDSRPAGIDASPARVTACNTGYPLEPGEIELRSKSAAITEMRPATWNEEPLEGRARLVASLPGRIDGLAGWFVAELAPGIVMSNAPDRADRINRRPGFLPFDRPIDVAAGDALDVSIRIPPTDMILAWEAVRPDGTDRQSHSTWKGILPVREMMMRTHDAAVPTLTDRGVARRTVLELCDGHRSVRDIEVALHARHPDLFPSAREASVFAAEVLAVYARV
jgi:precorrin-6B methylase 2